MTRYEAEKRGRIDVYELRKKKTKVSDIVAYVGGTILGLIFIIAAINS